NRHPCRFTPQINIEFRPAWFDGAPEIKIKSGSLRIVMRVDNHAALHNFDVAMTLWRGSLLP
ncbi:hypothetical protein, partial [Pseudomonas poae]|uniref:hypothetical protein n=1 Tax=Pseudomonas poae TaxID=200451 RepID=UPI001C82AA71